MSKFKDISLATIVRTLCLAFALFNQVLSACRASDDPAGQRADGAVPDQRYHGHRGTGELVEEQLVYQGGH